MISVRIDETGEYLNLLPEEKIVLKYQVFDVGSLGTIQGTFTNDFNLPDTAYNRAALGNATALNVFESTYRVNQKIPASCFQNNIQISKGFLQVTNSNKVIKTAFFGDNVEVLSLLRGKKLRDCDLSHLRHAYTAANIIASFNNTSGYIYPVIDYGLFTSRTPMSIASGEIYTAIFASDIMTAIFKDVGFKIDGTMLDRALYKKTIVPFVNNVFGYSKEFVAEKNFRAYTGQLISIASGVTTKNIFNFKDNTESVSSSLFNLTTDRYTADDNYQIKIDFGYDDRGFQIQNSPSTTRPTLYIKKNGVVIADNSGNTNIVHANILLTLNAGDYIECEVKNNSASAIKFQCSVNGTVSRDFVAGSIIYPETVLPDMDQVDFVKWALFRFLSVMTVDLYSKTIYFNQFNDLNNNPVDDWSNKVDISKEVDTDYSKIVSNYGTKNLALYTIDDNDKQQTLYNADNDTPYGSGSFTIDNDFLGDEKNVFESKFSSTLSIETFGANNLFIPYIPRHLPNETDINVALPRVLTYYGNVDLGQISEATSMTILGTTVTSIPFTYFYKSKLGFGVDDFKESLAFGIPNVFAPNDQAAFSSDYLTLFNIFNNPNTKRAYLKLNQIDIVNLSHLKKKYIERFGGYFYLNIIEEYDASGDSVLCELVKI